MYLKIFKSINLDCKRGPWGQSYKAKFSVNNIKNGFNKLNFTLNYINFDVIYIKIVLMNYLLFDSSSPAGGSLLLEVAESESSSRGTCCQGSFKGASGILIVRAWVVDNTD